MELGRVDASFVIGSTMVGVVKRASPWGWRGRERRGVLGWGLEFEFESEWSGVEWRGGCALLALIACWVVLGLREDCSAVLVRELPSIELI